jgi:hypothetical protein
LKFSTYNVVFSGQKGFLDRKTLPIVPYRPVTTAETLFRQWFVEEAGEDWEDWEEVPLSYFGKIICGKTPSKKKPEFYNGIFIETSPTVAIQLTQIDSGGNNLFF